MDAVNGYFRQRYEHQYLYDRETLARQLMRVGFTTVLEVSFGTGAVPALLLDDAKYEWESLYIEGTRERLESP